MGDEREWGVSSHSGSTPKVANVSAGAPSARKEAGLQGQRSNPNANCTVHCGSCKEICRMGPSQGLLQLGL